MHHADERLARRKRTDNLLTYRPLLDPRDEILDHRQGHVGFEQRHADLAQRIGDIVFGQARMSSHRLYDSGETLGQVVEHRRYQAVGERYSASVRRMPMR